MSIICAVAGLAAFLAHDFERIGCLQSRIWRFGFFTGLALWIASALLVILPVLPEVVVWRAGIFGMLTLAFVALEIYALFFALPFVETYVQGQGKHCVCRRGIYGLCRHPGFWSFSGICLSVTLAVNAPSVRVQMGALAALNLIYILIQDRRIFVREFSDYLEYQREVPFLLPKCKRRQSAGV